jgi:hypothetical protein
VKEALSIKPIADELGKALAHVGYSPDLNGARAVLALEATDRLKFNCLCRRMRRFLKRSHPTRKTARMRPRY